MRVLDGYHFRRQAPMGAYVVDFVCHHSRLVVEVDGGVHRMDVVAARDAERDAWLALRGYKVIRIANSQAILATEDAVAAILASAGACTPTPDPSPQGNYIRA